LKRKVMFGVLQATAFAWAVVVLLRTVDLGWNPFVGIGLGIFGALPISLLGMRMNSRKRKP